MDREITPPILVAAPNLPLVLPALADDLKRVVEEHVHDELTAETVQQSLMEERSQLWLCLEDEKVLAWAVTIVVSYPSTRRLRFALLSGEDMDAWLDRLDYLEEWSKQYGCEGIEAWVRPGLRKKLEKQGFRKTYEVVTKKFDERVVN